MMVIVTTEEERRELTHSLSFSFLLYELRSEALC